MSAVLRESTNIQWVPLSLIDAHPQNPRLVSAPVDHVSMVLAALDRPDVNAITIKAKGEARFVALAIADEKFTGEYIHGAKIDWLDRWFPLAYLSKALDMWGIDFANETPQWELSKGAAFLRACDVGIFSGAAVEVDEPVRREEPPEPDFSEYAGDSYVYFLQAKSLGHIKIGTTTNMQRRFSEIKTGCPDELVLLGITKGDANIERQIHEKFADSRVRGEWFAPSDDLASFIERVARNA